VLTVDRVPALKIAVPDEVSVPSTLSVFRVSGFATLLSEILFRAIL
jgi:hypothetical protein